MSVGRLLKPQEAANYLGISKSFLDKDRIEDRRVPFLRIGRKIAYDLADLNLFIEQAKSEAMNDADAG